MTIVARGADAVGSLHRYVTIIDSDDVVYLVGFGDATDSGYLTTDGQWGNGRDLPESMEFGSVMAAYFNDNTEGANNLALLQVLTETGLSFSNTPMVISPRDSNDVGVVSYSCADGVLDASAGSQLGAIYDDGEYAFAGFVDCSGGSTGQSASVTWFTLARLGILVTGGEPVTLREAWNTYILILQGHFNYTIPNSIV